MPNPRIPEAFGKHTYSVEESSDDDSGFRPRGTDDGGGESSSLPAQPEDDEEVSGATTEPPPPHKDDDNKASSSSRGGRRRAGGGTAVHIPDSLEYKDLGRNLSDFAGRRPDDPPVAPDDDGSTTRTPPMYGPDDEDMMGNGGDGSADTGGGGGGGSAGRGGGGSGRRSAAGTTTRQSQHGRVPSSATRPTVTGPSTAGEEEAAVAATVSLSSSSAAPPRPRHVTAVAAEVHDPERERRELRHEVSHELEQERKRRFARCLKYVVIPLAIVLVVAIVVFAVAPWKDDDEDDDATRTPEVEPLEKPFDVDLSQVFIARLCSPRHLTVHEDTLYVPEAGVGPRTVPVNDTTSEDCYLSPSFGYYICTGDTGRITAFPLLGNSVGRTVLEGLWSGRAVNGRTVNDVYGVHDVAFDERNGFMLAVVGKGYVNATEIAERRPDEREKVGALIGRDNFVFTVPWEEEFDNNYNQGRFPEANPFGLTIHDGNVYMVDAGGDALYTYIKAGLGNARVEDFRPSPDSVIVVPPVTGVSALTTGRCNGVTPPNGPSFCGTYNNDDSGDGEWLYDTSPVPTAVRVHNGKLYVSFLTGIFWNEPHANIWEYELDDDGIPVEESARLFLPVREFWAIIDFRFHQDDVWVLEMNPGGSFVPFAGRLSRVEADGTVVRLNDDDLNAPTGLAFSEDGRRVFVSNNANDGGVDGCVGEIRVGNLRQDESQE